MAPVPDIRKFNARVPPALAQIMYRMLEKEPADRYQTPAALLKALARGGGKPSDSNETDRRDLLAGLAQAVDEKPAPPTLPHRPPSTVPVRRPVTPPKRYRLEDEDQKPAARRR